MSRRSDGRSGAIRVSHLTGASIADAPQCCVGCTWWQARPFGRAVDKRRWIGDVEDDFGPWGKLYREGERLVAFLQYGPADAFGRAVDLPAGPPSGDAVLVTCSFLLDVASPWALQSLFLACIGEARDGGHPAIEAFAHRYDESEDFRARFLRHRTVFPRDFLADFGFRTLRRDGRIELMRLELGGIVTVEEPQSALARALDLVAERARRPATAAGG
jgi:hypothetical protein